MLLTFIVYQIYRELREATRDRDVDEFFFWIGLKAIGTAAFWPFVLIPMGAHLASQRAKTVWYSVFSLLTLLSIVTGSYIVVGILLAALRITVYICLSQMTMQTKENESSEQVIS